jgi:hypothetical protein
VKALFISFILIVFAALTLVLSACSSSALPVEGNKAAIVDQLSITEPNPAFIHQATATLQEQGLKVDYFQGDQITVDLYRRLPESGYSLIIFRAHSGLMGPGPKANQKTCLFTNQPYSKTDEFIDQLTDRVVSSAVDDKPPLFGIGAEFVAKSMRGKFNQTLIIMMGCSSLDSTDLARAFVMKGSSACIGWNAGVHLKFDEEVVLSLLDRLLCDHLPVDAAVDRTMREKGPDPDSGALLKYYPVLPEDSILTGLPY